MVELKDEIIFVLTQGLNDLGLSGVVDEVRLEKLARYFSLLLDRNQTLNLISAKQDLATQVAVHLLDSLTPLLWANWPDQLSALDFGAGGGLPALPLSVVFPDWEYTLVEATGKKAAFLTEAKEALGLTKVFIVNRYLESGRNTEGRVYELITARAVSDLTKLAAIVGPRLAVGGYFIAFKGPKADQELGEAQAALAKRKLHLADRLDLVLPGVEARRSLLLFEKVGK